MTCDTDCPKCGTEANSTYREDGSELHTCPECGEKWGRFADREPPDHIKPYLAAGPPLLTADEQAEADRLVDEIGAPDADTPKGER